MSLKIFRFSGIDVKVHITFALVLVWAAWQWGIANDGGFIGAVYGLALMLLLFASVTLHEFGHALTAQAFGIPTRDITLWPLGGVARLEKIPRNPLQELAITAAGPLVNVVIGLVLTPIVAFLILTQDLNVARLVGSFTITGLLFNVASMNIILAIFNLLPAFPMDGGRVFRSLLALFLPYGRATRIAVGLGQLLAIGMGVFGFVSGNILLGLVGVFIFFGARQEGNLVRTEDSLGRLTVEQAYSRQTVQLHPDDVLQRPLDLTLSSLQADFAVIDNGQLIGLVTRTGLINALNQFGRFARVGDVMQRDYVTAHPSERLFDVQVRLVENSQRVAPVVADGRVLGLLTANDIEEIFRLFNANPDLIPAMPSPQV